MNFVARSSASVLLAACVCVGALACNVDEPATFVPRSGDWSYAEQEVVSNSCDAGLGLPDPLTTFLLDYDAGDEFQIELGATDITCEIDGVDFTCGSYLAGTFDVPGFLATLSVNVQYAGEFESETVATGNEVTSVTCVGDDCVKLDTLPCSRNVTFNAEFLN